jgi:hypothetical protein
MNGSDEDSPDGLWQIRWRMTRDRWSWREAETQYEITILKSATQEVIFTFWREEFGSERGLDKRGVRSMHFTSDSRSVLVEYEDASKETVALPDDVR